MAFRHWLFPLFFAAEVSTCDTVLYMLATSLSKDLYQTFIKPDATDAELLSMTRKITAVCGALGIIIAYYLASIISAMAIFYSLMTVSLAAPFLFGLFTKKASTKGAFLSAVLGVAVVMGLRLFNGGMGIGILNATSCGILVAALVMALSLFVFSPNKEGINREIISFETMGPAPCHGDAPFGNPILGGGFLQGTHHGGNGPRKKSVLPRQRCSKRKPP